MFTIYVNGLEVRRCGTWSSVKAYMIAKVQGFCFVVCGDRQWNVRLTSSNRLIKSEV